MSLVGRDKSKIKRWPSLFLGHSERAYKIWWTIKTTTCVSPTNLFCIPLDKRLLCRSAEKALGVKRSLWGPLKPICWKLLKRSLQSFLWDGVVGRTQTLQAAQESTLSVVRLVACSPLLNSKHRALPWNFPPHQQQIWLIPKGQGLVHVPLFQSEQIGPLEVNPRSRKGCWFESTELVQVLAPLYSQSRMKWPWWYNRQSLPDFDIWAGRRISMHSRKFPWSVVPHISRLLRNMRACIWSDYHNLATEAVDRNRNKWGSYSKRFFCIRLKKLFAVHSYQRVRISFYSVNNVGKVLHVIYGTNLPN